MLLANAKLFSAGEIQTRRHAPAEAENQAVVLALYLG